MLGRGRLDGWMEGWVGSWRLIDWRWEWLRYTYRQYPRGRLLAVCQWCAFVCHFAVCLFRRVGVLLGVRRHESVLCVECGFSPGLSKQTCGIATQCEWQTVGQRQNPSCDDNKRGSSFLCRRTITKQRNPSQDKAVLYARNLTLDCAEKQDGGAALVNGRCWPPQGR